MPRTFGLLAFIAGAAAALGGFIYPESHLVGPGLIAMGLGLKRCCAHAAS